MHLLFPLLFTWSFLCNEGTVFVWITIFCSPREISAISSRSNALVDSSKLCLYFVFHVCVQDDLGCSTSFIFALRALSRQVVSIQVIPDSCTSHLHRCQTFNGHPKRDWTWEKHSKYIFSLQVKISAVYSKDYTTLSKVCMIHFIGGKILKKNPKQLNSLKWGSHRAHDVREEMKGSF